MDAIFKRVSVRNFLDKSVEDEKITQILRAAMQSPSAGNQQPWEFYVVKDKSKIAELSKVSEFSGCAANAQVVIVPCEKKSGARFPELVEIDNAIATENILLEAVEQGLGAVWLAVAPFEDRIAKARKALSVPENLVPFALVPLGYAAKEQNQQNRFDEKKIHMVG